MIALFASFFSLFVGPLVYQTFGPLRRTDRIVTGIVLCIVAATIILEILPSSYSVIGLFAILLAMLGFLGPTIIERTFRKAADTTHKLTILLGITGLIFHAFIDGVAIQSTEGGEQNGLSLAIVLHRLPIGLTIWWLLKPLLGERLALMTLFIMGLATVMGYYSSQAVDVFHDSQIFAGIQALIAGSLLHVVIHKPHEDGCMHSSLEHDQYHHADENVGVIAGKPHSHVVDNVDVKNNAKQFFFPASFLKDNRWELVGFFIGIAILVLLSFYHH